MMVMDQIIEETYHQGLYLDMDVADKWVRVHKSVVEYRGISSLRVLRLTAYGNDNEVIMEQLRLIPKE
jgi:hypothetical protein